MLLLGVMGGHDPLGGLVPPGLPDQPLDTLGGDRGEVDPEYSVGRPVATVPQVFALAGRMPARFRAFVLAAAFTDLRWGELIALRRCDVDTDATTVRVPRRLAGGRAARERLRRRVPWNGSYRLTVDR